MRVFGGFSPLFFAVTLALRVKVATMEERGREANATTTEHDMNSTVTTYYIRSANGIYHIHLHDMHGLIDFPYVHVRQVGAFARALVARKVGHTNFRLSFL